MKAQAWALALAALLAARAGGLLPQGKEMEELKLVTALAVDGAEEVTVTAVTGVRVTEDEEPEVFTGTGKSLAEACRSLREESSRRAYLGQSGQLLMGEDCELLEDLRFVTTDRELQMDSLLYIVKGQAGPALGASADKVAGETGGKDPRGKTVGETLSRLEEGEYALVPALAPDKDGALAPAGWAVVGPGGTEGFLEGDAALGASLLTGLGKDRVVTLPGGAVELEWTRTWAKDGKVNCALRGRAVQGDPTEEELSAWGEEKVRSALASGWDCWGLDREIAALRPWDWGELRGSDVSKLDVKGTGKLVGNHGR